MTGKKKYTSEVAPRRGAWIEIRSERRLKRLSVVAPRRGAWIEIAQTRQAPARRRVAPRRGAWIEIANRPPCRLTGSSLPAGERGSKYHAV